MSDESPPNVFIYREIFGDKVPIPDRFFTGQWSVVAIAAYFHILVSEDGISYRSICAKHPAIPRDEIANAIDALLSGGFIENHPDVSPGEPGYIATGAVTA